MGGLARWLARLTRNGVYLACVNSNHN